MKCLFNKWQRQNPATTNTSKNLKTKSKTNDNSSQIKRFNTENKVWIREEWNKPILKFISAMNGKGLVYVGLPAGNADDIVSWIEYINVVYAFQCRDYPNPHEVSQSREVIEKLEGVLMELERKSKIDRYTIYDGYVEEVVLRGYDNSPKRVNFNLSNFVTLYNLDFCNSITSPVEFVNLKGEVTSAYKMEAIQDLISIQKKSFTSTSKFVLLLTIHSSYKGKELNDFITSPPSELRETMNDYRKLGNIDLKPRVLRLFIAHYLLQKFNANGFSFEMLPTILYNGLKETKLLHFTVLGNQEASGPSGVLQYQKLTDILSKSFIRLKSPGEIESNGVGNETEVSNLNVISSFKNSKTYKKSWIAK